MDNKLSNRLKSLLLKQKVSIDEDQLLQDIFSELPPEKKNNRFVILLLALGLMSIVAITLYNKESKSEYKNHPVTSDKKLDINIQASNFETINQTSTKREVEQNENLTIQDDSSLISSLSKTDSRSQNIDKEPTTKKKVTSSLDFENNESKDIAKNSNNTSDRNSAKSTTQDYLNVTESASNNATLSSSSINGADNLPITNSESTFYPADNTSTTKPLFAESMSTVQSSEKQTATLQFLYSSSILPLPLKYQDFTIPSLVALKKRTPFQPSNIQLELNGQGYYQDPKLKNTQSRPSYQLQTLLKYKMGKFSPIIGLSFKRTNSVLDHTWSEERNIIDIDEANVFCPNDPNGCLTYSNVIQTTRHVVYNNIDIINIPIGIEYQSSGRTSWWTRALVNIPISSTFKFEYLDADDNIIELRDIENAKVQTSPEVQISAGIAHRIFRDTDIRVGVYHDYSMKNVSISPAEFALPKGSFGVQFGVGYLLR